MNMPMSHIQAVAWALPSKLGAKQGKREMLLRGNLMEKPETSIVP